MANYNEADVRSELTRNLNRYKSLKDAWEKVTYPTKKDGSPFKVLSKNFENATLKQWPYAIHTYQLVLNVYTYAKHENGTSEAISDTIYCYSNTEERSLTLDEIKVLVADRIAYYKTLIKNVESDLKALHELYTSFYDSYKSAIDKLNAACADKSTYYAIKKCVTEYAVR